jgi:hypothetical protein
MANELYLEEISLEMDPALLAGIKDHTRSVMSLLLASAARNGSKFV